MKVTLFSLFLIAYTYAGSKTDDSFGDLVETFNVTSILSIFRGFKNMAETVIDTIEPRNVNRTLLKRKFRDAVEKSKNMNISIKENIALFLFQGDITLTEDQAKDIREDIDAQAKKIRGGRQKRFAYEGKNYPNNRWDQGVHYYFHASASEEQKQAFRRAVQAWREDTCVNFFEDADGSNATDRVVVARSNFCSSYVGKIGGEQALYQANYCEHFRGAAHAIGHLLGLLHPMSREDRDDYITLKSDRIMPAILFQFLKQTNKTNHDYGIGYDFGSIMHSSIQSGSIPGKPEITLDPKDKKYRKTPPSESISFADLHAVNVHYGCKEKCRKNVACKHGGIQHPRKCDSCLCPSGFAGRLCDKKPAGCGSIKIALKDRWNTLTEELPIRNEAGQSLDGYTRCTYWIQSPPRTKIEIELVAFDNSLNSTKVHCNHAGVEIKTNKDQSLTGYRFCSNEDRSWKLTSHSTIVPVIFYSRSQGRSAVSLKYRYT